MPAATAIDEAGATDMSLLVDMGPACTCDESVPANSMTHESTCRRGDYLDGFRDGFRTGRHEGYHAGGHDMMRASTELNRHLQDTSLRESLATLLMFLVDAEEAA
jgi:hypothetical protein